MKNLHLIAFILFTLSLNITPLSAQSNKFQATEFINPNQKSEFLLYLAKNYSSNAYSILKKRQCDFYTKWADGKSHFQILSSYAAVIHETCHSINSEIGGFMGRGFYISPTIEINVSKSKVFKTSEMDKNIPENWKSAIFRYKTYVQGLPGDEEIASIYDGIYGLMDEFDAYYQSTRAVVELYPYYKALASNSNPYYLTLYISNCYSSIYAYHEFKLFIAWYLKYAKKNYPEIYKGIIQNNEFKAVYTLIDKAYTKIIQQYFDNRKSILEKINKEGKMKAEISGKYFYVNPVSKKGSSLGYGIPDIEISYLKSLFTVEDYQMLHMLRFENMDEMNYKSFLD